ncbi:MAG: c-type cytochrome domain-containing protein, partial [Pseudomonadota bacterium]
PLYLTVVEGRMPQNGPLLTTDEVLLIRNWINDGAANEAGEFLNQPPSLAVGANLEVQLPINSVPLLAMASDSDGSVLKIIWSQVSGLETAQLENSRSLNATASNLEVGIYVFRILVEDDFGAAATGEITITVLPAAGDDSPPAQEEPPVLAATFSQVNGIFQSRCLSCHTGSSPQGGFSVASYADVLASNKIIAGNAQGSILYQQVLNGLMPRNSTELSNADKATIQSWINDGAQNN